MLSTKKMTVVCLDFEGVLIPEIWKGLAQLSNIEELELTTRDIADYDSVEASSSRRVAKTLVVEMLELSAFAADCWTMSSS